jgi:glutathione S-transferase
MPKLLHFTLDPLSRRIRLSLAEYGDEVQLVEERPWAPSALLVELNPAAHVPVLIEDSGIAIPGAEALSEYLEETRGQNGSLIPGTPQERAEVRRLLAWFDGKFYAEVSEPILTEKVISRFTGRHGGGRVSGPDMARVRPARQALRDHLEYIAMLSEQRSWLAGEHISLADLAAAAHLSTIDYLGDVPWADHPIAQVWYSRIKSRPSFRTLLNDTIPGLAASEHYANLDF